MNLLLFKLLLKLLLTPVLIGGISIAGRLWGPGVSGVLASLPLTSAPVALFLTLSQGPSFAAQVSVGILAGTLSVGVFALAYSHLALALVPLGIAPAFTAATMLTLAMQGVSLHLVRRARRAAVLTRTKGGSA